MPLVSGALFPSSPNEPVSWKPEIMFHPTSHPTSATPQEMQDEDDKGHDQNDVDEPTGNVESKSTAPEDQQNDGNNE